MKFKSSKSALLKSGLSLLLCISMLVGSTFAWFTDEVTSSGNIIQSGSLDIDMQWATAYDGENTVWNDAAGEDAKPVFDYQNWEPGYTEVRYIKVSNEGNLAFKWLMNIIPVGMVGKLAEVIDVSYDVVTNNPDFVAPTAENKLGSLKAAGNLNAVIKGEQVLVQGVLLPEGEQRDGFYSGELIACIALHMRENASNEYQGENIGDSFNILLKATQYNHETDSFSNDYDLESTYPHVVIDLQLNASVEGIVDADNRLTQEVVLTDVPTGITATLPVGTLLNAGTTLLVLKITEDDVDSNVTLSTRVGYDVTVEGVSSVNDKPIIIAMPKALPAEQTGLQLYHSGNAMTRVYSMEALSQKEGNNDTYGDKYIYDFNSGNVFFSVTHFSNVSLASTSKVTVLKNTIEGIEKALPSTGEITIPADGNTYILKWDSGDQSKKNPLNQTITHGWYNINPGTYSRAAIKVEMGATVVLNGVNIRTSAGIDALEIVPDKDGQKYGTTTKIYIADGTNNWLTGRSGIGFGGQWHQTDVYVEGYGNLYATAIGANCAAIGVSDQDDGDHHKMHFNVSHLRAIPMNNSAGIGSGGNSWRTLKLIEFNGSGLYQIYRGGNGASVGSGLNSDSVGEIIVNSGVELHCYPQPWTAYSRDLGAGIYAGVCEGIYIADGATVTGYSTQGNDKYYPNAGAVPSGRQRDAEVIVQNFSYIKNIDATIGVDGKVSYAIAYVNDGTVEFKDLSKFKVSNGKVSVNAVYGTDVNSGETKLYCLNNNASKVSVVDESPKYTVVFDANGGTLAQGTDSSVVTSLNSEITLPEAEYANHNFFGWATEPDGGTHFGNAGEKYTVEGSITLYAQWQEKASFDVTFVDGDTTIKTEKVYIDSKLQLPEEPTKEYHRFIGWKDQNGEKVDFATYKVEGPVIFYAHWEKIQFTVTYKDGDNETTEKVEAGAEITLSKPDEKPNYTFKGWSTTIDGDVIEGTTYRVEKDITFYAQWEEQVKAAEFLYRVGNQNNVTTAQIATMLTGKNHNGDNVSIEKNVGDAEYNGSKFTGTGLAKVTVDGTDYFVEVVNAVNTTTGNIRNSGLLNGTNFVLLNDVKYTETQTVTMEGSTIYGNGFKYDFSNFTPQASELGDGDPSKANIFVIHMKSATFDNVQLIGKVYTDGAYVYKADSSSDPENYMSLVFAQGDSRILNSYISGTRAPVRAEGNVTIENTTLAGGNVANIDVKGGVLNIKNVTTINQGTNPVGYGIFMDNDAGIDEEGNPQPITVNVDGLTSYNWLKSTDSAYMDDRTNKPQKPMPTLLSSVFDDAQFAGAEAINFRVVCLNENESVVVNGLGNPIVAAISGNNGRLWAEKGSLKEAPPYVSNGTGTVRPIFTWKEYSASTEFTKGGSVEFDANLLTAQKYGQTLEVSVSCNGGTQNGKNIIFNTEGTYTVKYSVTDPNNYRLNSDGGLEQYTEQYEFEIQLTVNEVVPQTKHATFKIAGSETTIVEKDGKKYVVANSLGSYTDAWETDKTFGFKYPEVATLMSDGINGEHSKGYKACYPIFEAVEIIDYANGGTGDPVKYNSSTQTLPSGLKYVRDRDNNSGTGLKLAYQTGSSSDTTKASVISGKLCFTSPSVTANRSEHFTWIEYSYTDNAGETYYFVIGYRAQAQTYKSCVTGDTLVMLADGSQKRADQLTVDDQLLVWNFFEGKYDVAPAAIIFYHGDDIYNVIKLNFEDGTSVKVIGNHAFYDVELNEFVFITEENVAQYVGDHFVKVDGDGTTSVKLINYNITEEFTGSYSVYSAKHINFITEGMFSLTPAPIEGFFGCFEYGENMKYDEAQMQSDVEKYGLYEYEVFAEYGVTYEQYVAFNMPYLKFLVGRGVITFDDILTLLSIYVVK